jgi:hypothetical protein
VSAEVLALDIDVDLTDDSELSVWEPLKFENREQF